MLPGASQPEMPVLHQERGPVLLGCDWIVLGNLENPKPGQVHFVPARGAAVLAHFSLNLNAGLLGQLVQEIELFRGEGSLEGHTLNNPRSVTQQDELQLSAAALVVDPSAKSDFGPFVRRDVLDPVSRHIRNPSD